ncbi:carbonic anhydrase 2-like [Saccostrea echinata]|uniref:carbonic anhydrase 2-like n=1 Tax=Saccostrea echinata TaxID=191078 RepID=UPI002A7EC073|nr:carbonic anhydrase 2-like [Saccostrea echinata]
MKGILVLFTIFEHALLSNAAGHEAWNYTDQGAWSSMTGSQCSGTSQSPINFPPMVEMVYSENLKPFSLTGYDQLVTSPTIENNGHSVTVKFTNEAHVSGGDLGSKFKAAQFHFHWGNDNNRGSEHTYNGKTYPAELHVVHYNTKYADINEAVSKPDGLAVLGFFIEVGPIHNCNFGPVIDTLKNIPDKGNSTSLTPFKLRHILPMQLRDYYRYMGSLTTPPCSETVKWTVFRDRLYMSEEQLQEFRKIYFDSSKTKLMVDNWRPPQPRNGRKVYISFDVKANSSPVHLFNFILAIVIFCVQLLCV